MSLKESRLDRGGVVFTFSLLETDNAVLGFLFDGKMKIGTIAFAMPPKGETGAGTSSVLLGGKYLVASRAMAERLAATYGKMALASMHTNTTEQEALRVFLQLLGKLSPSGPGKSEDH